MPVDITDRTDVYFIRSRHERKADPLEYQRRFLAGLAVQKRVTQGKRKLTLVRTNTAAKKEIGK